MTLTPLSVMQTSMDSMHRMLDKVIAGMTLEQLNFRPQEGGVSPFFSLWHYVRTEDNIVNWVLHSRQTIWLEGGYDRALGLPRTSQGTGMSTEEANAVVLRDLDLWREYQPRVWERTREELRGLDPAELESRRITVRPGPEMSLWNALMGFGLTHGYRHIGEIEYARGVIGLGGLSI